MGYAPKIVLQLPLSNPELLPPFVEACIRDGVSLISIVGEGCRDIEDAIDDLVVGDGSDARRFIVTTSHPGESLAQAMRFAEIFDAKGAKAIELVKL